MFSVIVNEILKYIGIISLLFGVFWSLHKIYIIFIKPKLKRAKHQKLFEMVEDWFDEIDNKLELGLNYALLNNKENKIRQYIIDNNLANDKMRFNNKFRKDFLRNCGIKEKYIDDRKLFYKYSRVPNDWISLDVYINLLIGEFYTFSANFDAKSAETNFADVEMRVKLLKNYWKIRR